MKILFLTDNFPPEVNAPATRTYEHCKEWVKMGAEVTVITCFPNFPQGKVYKGYKNKWRQVERIDGIKVIRVWSYITANSGFIKRIMDFLSFSLTSFFYLLFKNIKYDVIIATSPQFFTGLTAMFISKVKKIPWIFEVRDLWPEGIIILKKDSLSYKFLEWIEKQYYKSSLGIVTVTSNFKKDIISRFPIPENKISVIYNGSNNSLFKKQPKNNKLISGHDLQGKFIIGYAGTLGVSHSLDFIAKTLPEIYKLQPKIHFLFIGSGAMEKELKSIKDELNIENLSILPPVEKEEIVNYISIFDVGLVPLKKNPAYLKVIPSKIFELASMQKPILLGVAGETKNILEKYKAGVFFEPENKNDFITKILYMFENRSKLDVYNEGLIRLSVDFDRKHLANKMYKFIRERLSEDSNNK